MAVVNRVIGPDTFRQDRLCVEDILIDNTGYGGNFFDANRDLLLEYMWDSINSIRERINTYTKIGRDTECLSYELIDHFAVLELFLLILEEQTCFGIEKWDEIESEYQLDCIRDHWKCQYGKGNIVEEIIQLLKIRFGADGIDFMTIEGVVCKTFEVR